MGGGGPGERRCVPRRLEYLSAVLRSFSFFCKYLDFAKLNVKLARNGSVQLDDL